MQVNNASSSQVASSSLDANPNQVTPVVTGVTNSSELMTTTSSACPQNSQSITNAHADGSPSEQAASLELSLDEMELEIDELGNISEAGINIHQLDSFDFDFSFDGLDELDEDEDEDEDELETRATQAQALSAELASLSPLTPAQESPIDLTQYETTDEEDEDDDDEDEKPSGSGVVPSSAGSTNKGDTFLKQLLVLPTKPFTQGLSAEEKELAIAKAGQARAERASARAKKRDANAPLPQRCERLTPLEKEKIVAYSFKHCRGFTLREALDFMNSRPQEAFKGISSSTGQPYTHLPFRTYYNMVKALKGKISKIP